MWYYIQDLLYPAFHLKKELIICKSYDFVSIFLNKRARIDMYIYIFFFILRKPIWFNSIINNEIGFTVIFLGGGNLNMSAVLIITRGNRDPTHSLTLSLTLHPHHFGRKQSKNRDNLIRQRKINKSGRARSGSPVRYPGASRRAACW